MGDAARGCIAARARRLNTFRIEMMVPSWTQYMLQQERMTKADGDVIAQAESLHVGPNPPEVRTYLGVNKELLSHKHRDATTIDSKPEATPKEVTRNEKTNVKAGPL